MQNNGIRKINAVWRTYVKNIAAQLGIQREVKAVLSLHIDTPQVIGFFKPVILLPAACLVNLSTEQLEAVLLHELVHIKRYDYFVNLFVTSVEILFFFNPFVKELTASLRKEREYSCDDMVMQFQYQPHNYASALLTLEKSRLSPVTYGIAAGGKNQQQLLTRIERIMGIENRKIGFYRMGACLMALLLLAFIATINPAKVAADNFGEANLALAFANDNFADVPANNEAAKTIGNIYVANTAKKEIEIKRITPPVSSTAKKDWQQSDESLLAAITSTAAITAKKEDDGDDDTNEDIKTAAHKEKIDFALPQKEKPIMPASDIAPEAIVAEPYVPASSFSFQLVQDTALPKLRTITYNERLAKDALLKTQKALEQLNWQKIEKQLKYNKRELAKLKTEITVQLQKLNWQQINSDVTLQLNQEQVTKIQDAVKDDQAMRQYQRMATYGEAINRQLAEQEQLTREATQRMLESQKAAEQQRKKTEADMKKKRTIYI